jgi:hypothetical protein
VDEYRRPKGERPPRQEGRKRAQVFDALWAESAHRPLSVRSDVIGQHVMGCAGIAQCGCSRHSVCDPKQQIISVTADGGPAPLAELVDHFSGLSATLSQVPANEHFIDVANALEIGYHLEKSHEVAMRISDECNRPRDGM